MWMLSHTIVYDLEPVDGMPASEHSLGYFPELTEQFRPYYANALYVDTHQPHTRDRDDPAASVPYRYYTNLTIEQTTASFEELRPIVKTTLAWLTTQARERGLINSAATQK